jgi:pimeloyl-ACP methyl ester carboxylesterase
MGSARLRALATLALAVGWILMPKGADSPTLAPGVEAQAQTVPKATFVLVHPAWTGGWCWKKVIPFLRAEGYNVYTPTLTGLGERAHLANPMIGLETHVQDVVRHLEYEDLSRVILVGHSNGGTLITAVADRVPARLAHLVYLDAFVPDDGQATIDLVPPNVQQELKSRVAAEGYGWLLPSLRPISWDEMVRDVWRVTDEADRRWMVARFCPTPFKTFTDPVRRRNPDAEKLPHTYIRCRQHPSPAFDRYAEMARRTQGWRYRELDAAHLPFVTVPRELAVLLLEVAS